LGCSSIDPALDGVEFAGAASICLNVPSSGMINLMKTKKMVCGLFLLAGMEASGALVYLLLLPADPKNAVLWGYSWARLSMAFGMMVAAAACFAAGGFVRRRNDVVNRGLDWLSKKIVRLWVAGTILATVAIVAWIAVWLPAYRYGNKLLLYERLFPVIVWVGLVCVQGLLVLLIWQDVLNYRRFWRALQSEDRLWWFVVSGMSLFVVIQAAVSLLDFLSAPDVMQYNPPGVPVLPLQVLAVWLTGIFALVIIHILHRTNTIAKSGIYLKKIDWGIFVLIWVIAAIIWIRTPMQPTFFAPLQRPPDWVLFPYSDAALYDRTAQFALMGLGLGNGGYVDKPLYSSFLTVLHLIGGQNYAMITGMQAAIFALLPALAYAVGKRIHSVPTGIVVALLVTFRGANAIAGGHWIQTAHARLLLSEMPTALALAFLIYFLLRWYKNPDGHFFPVLAGGVLGLSTLIRHNPWFLAPVVALVAILVYWRKWKRWLVQVSFFGLAMLMVISPWMYYSWKTVGTPLYFMIPLRGVVWKGRLQPEISENSIVPALGSDMLAFSAGASAAGGILLTNSGTYLPEIAQSASGFGRVAQIFSTHFYNNLRGSLLVLPDTWVADDLDHTLSAPDSLWLGGWTEGLSVWMVVNLFLILIGIGASWKRIRIAGIAPLIVYSGYLVAVSVARTSGGRYLVPVDWVVLLYYAVGIVQAIAWAVGISPVSQRVDEQSVQGRTPLRHWVVGVAGLVLMTGMIPFVQQTISPSLTSSSAAALPSAEWMEKVGVDPFAVKEFLKRDGAVVRYGKAVYPRFYSWKEGESLGCFGARPYPRLVFELIGEEGVQCVTLPIANMSYDVQLHYSTSVVLGCEGGGDWIVMFPEKDLALVRFTQIAPPTCPLKYPNCADNRNCQ